MNPDTRQASYREVFSVPEYRALFTSDATSLLGDQVAAVALAVLLYQRSGSALIAALGYSAAFLPWAIGGPVLSALADRLPARQVVVGCDLLRAALIGLAAVPGTPLLVVGLLVLTAAMLAPPFDASISALYPQVLEGDRYAVGVSLRDAVHQGAQFVGFLTGGALILAIGPQWGMALDALSFAISALLLRRGLNRRPPASAEAAGTSLLRDSAEGLRLVSGDPRLHGPLLLGVLGAAYVIVPEAIAPVYAHSVGAGAGVVGLVMGSVAAGRIIGGVLLTRLVPPAVRPRLMWPLAVIGTLPLLPIAARPTLPVALALFALAGAASAYQIAANTAFAMAAPAHARARVFGIAMTGMYGGQALAIVAAGAAAQFVAPTTVIAGAGVAGAGAIALLRLRLAAGAPTRDRSTLLAQLTAPPPEMVDAGLV
ncbi:MAG: MFS transporter [Kineosporiaceae bacterium]